ncbi:WD40 repeat domain-containing protein [Actinoplanes sp. DH11]|uniref:NACHT and WD40 repeat domain-containing protein n=1 Tax=Actinoplanes sp. DH11 TaxID=2857011 RepID=UPI001E3429E7|nr:WD40 repeat domain-containing protein [Actinoplanes sp. DH11]
MLKGRPRSRGVALSVLLVFALGFGAWMATTGLDSAAAVATVMGLLVAVAALAVAIVQAFPVEARTADTAKFARRLARDVRAQWIGEAEARWLRNELEKTPVLPLSWAITGRDVGDREGQRLTAPFRRLEGRFDEVAASLAEVYRGVDSRRLILLGEPGSGKTVVAMLLTAGLLPEERMHDGAPAPTPDDPVPVLLPASSWDPISQTLDDWIIQSLKQSYFGDEPEAPRALLAAGLLLPVIDGLDEIPEAARRSAVHALSRAVTHGRPVVVTCRSVEYEDTIKGGAPMLHRAPVIEVTPVRAADAIGYLQAANTAEPAVWEKVYAELRSPGPLSEALSTPLMITMASTVYGGPGGDPGPLLDTGLITCRHDVEDHLLDRVVVAEFRNDDRRPWQPPVAPSPWPADQVEKWLTFLAEYLHRYRERDIAWWRMSSRLLTPWAIPVIALAAGVVLLLLTAAGYGLFLAAVPDLKATGEDVFGASAAVGAGFAAVAMPILYAIPARAPGRAPTSFRGCLPRLRRGFAVGVVMAAVPAAPMLLGWAVGATAFGSWSFTATQEFLTGVALCAAGGVLLGSVIAADAFFSATSELSGEPSPARFLRDDRRSSLLGASAAAAVVALGGVPVVLAAATLGSQGAAGLLRWVLGYREPDGPPTQPLNVGRLSTEEAAAWVGFGILLPGIVVGILVLLTHAWPRYLAVRAVLVLRGRLPWNLPRFLRYARQRGLLRQSGGTYQFRHARLQERLAGRPAQSVPDPDPAVVARHRRLRSVVAVCTALVVLGATVTVLQRPATARAIALGPLPEQLEPRVVALNRDGTLLALAGVSGIHLWDLDLDEARGRRRAPLTLPRGIVDVNAVAVSAAGDTMAVAVRNDYYASQRINPFSVYLLTGHGTVRTRWDFGRPVDHLSFAPGNNKRLTAVDGVGRVLLLTEGRPRADELAVAGGPDQGPSAAAMTGESGVATAYEGSVSFHGSPGLPRLPWTGHTAPISALCLSTDGSMIVTGSVEGTLRFRAVGAMTESMHVTSGHLDSIEAIAVRDTAARTVVAADEGGAELWTVSEN